MFGDTLRAIRKIEGLTLRVGWTDPEVARIVAINQQGSADGRRPPPRPVLQPVLDENIGEILDHTQVLVAAAVTSMDPAVSAWRGLDALGDRIDAPLRGGTRECAQDRIWNGITHEVVG